MARHIGKAWWGMAVFAALAAGHAPAGERPVATSPSVFVPTGVFPSNTRTSQPAPGIEEAVSEGVDFRRASAAATDAIVESLTTATRFCASLPQDSYRVDCLSERLEAAARALPQTGDYADARDTLLTASRKLNRLARDNAAPDLPRIRASAGGQAAITTTRPLVPVSPARQAGINTQAEAVIDEAATILLRASDRPDEMAAQYRRISAAVDSNKVLLRSA